jgi:hypothetical protein
MARKHKLPKNNLSLKWCLENYRTILSILLVAVLFWYVISIQLFGNVNIIPCKNVEGVWEKCPLSGLNECDQGRATSSPPIIKTYLGNEFLESVFTFVIQLIFPITLSTVIIISLKKVKNKILKIISKITKFILVLCGIIVLLAGIFLFSKLPYMSFVGQGNCECKLITEGSGESDFFQIINESHIYNRNTSKECLVSKNYCIHLSEQELFNESVLYSMYTCAPFMYKLEDGRYYQCNCWK